MRGASHLVCLLSAWILSSSCQAPTAERAAEPPMPPPELEEVVERFDALGRFSGAVAVAERGDVVFAAATGRADRRDGTPNTVETPFDLGSLTKQFTAAAILALEAEGRLRVEDRLAEHLPDYPRPQAEAVTLHHLLAHRSGIPSLWRLGDGLDDVVPSAEPIRLAELLALFQDRPLLFEPGTRYRYSNSGYVVLAAVIERVSGMTYSDYLVRKIFEPLRMRRTSCGPAPGTATSYFGHPPATTAAAREDPSWSVGDGCVVSTVLDLARWDAALRNDSLLPAAQRRKLFTAHSEIRPGLGYGYGWFLSERFGRPAAHHSGAGEGLIAEMVRFLDDGVSMMALSNYAPRIGINAPAAILDSLGRLRFGLPVSLPPAVAPSAGAEARDVTGRYAFQGGGGVVVTDEDGDLWVEALPPANSVFDYGLLEDPAVLERGAEAARELLLEAHRGDFSAIALCPGLSGELAPGELEEEWRGTLPPPGVPLEASPALATRYPGEETLILVTRLGSERGESFFALDLTPQLELCGWYPMERREFDFRAAQRPPVRTRLLPLADGGFLIDGFNAGEPELRLDFHEAPGGAREIRLRGQVERRGARAADSGGRRGE